jgi:hypothetical protein
MAMAATLQNVDPAHGERVAVGVGRLMLPFPSERSVMKFLCLGYGDEKGWKGLSCSQQADALANDERLRERGDIVAAVAPATVVRAWGGTPDTARGPFARTELPLAGFALIEAENLEEVIALIAKSPCPVARGAVDVWPVQEHRA